MTTYTPTDENIERAIDEYQYFHSALGGNKPIQVEGAGYDADGGVVLVVFDTEYSQHLQITFHVDGTMTEAPLYVANNQDHVQAEQIRLDEMRNYWKAVK